MEKIEKLGFVFTPRPDGSGMYDITHPLNDDPDQVFDGTDDIEAWCEEYLRLRIGQ
jgi:hypothetical protein